LLLAQDLYLLPDSDHNRPKKTIEIKRILTRLMQTLSAES